MNVENNLALSEVPLVSTHIIYRLSLSHYSRSFFTSRIKKAGLEGRTDMVMDATAV